MTIKALVAVRSGSTRVQNKNLRPFCGSNLIKVKLEQLKRIPELDGIVLNSDDDQMLAIGREMGAQTVKREPYYASNSVVMSEVFVNMAQNMDTDVIVYANVTNPLLQDDTLRKAIAFYREHENEYDSVNSAHPIKEFMWLNGKAINYDPANQPRSQDLPDIMCPNAAFNIMRKEVMIRDRNIVSRKPYMYPIDYFEATDIDNMIDFEIAEFLYGKYVLQGKSWR